MAFHPVDSNLNPELPFEFIVQGVAPSHQSASKKAKLEWSQKIENFVGKKFEQVFPFEISKRLSVCIVHITFDRETGDLDNCSKLVLDAMQGQLFVNDLQLDEILLRRIESNSRFNLTKVSELFLNTLRSSEPAVYVKLSERIAPKDLLI